MEGLLRGTGWNFGGPGDQKKFNKKRMLSVPGVPVVLMWTGSGDRPPGNGSLARDYAKCDRMLNRDGVPC